MRLVIFLSLLLFTLVVFFPGLINPTLIVGRNNDLNEFFWPIFFFTKDHFFELKSLPLWNNLILSGYPLVADPQAPIFYLPNILYLFLPLKLAFLISIIMHVFVGGIGIYLCSRQIFRYSKTVSLYTAFLYIVAPRLISYIVAGHLGLIYSFAWIPFVILSIYKLIHFPSSGWIIILALSLSSIFFTHTITFIIISLFSIFFFFVLLLTNSNKTAKIKSITTLIISFFTFFGLTSIALFPQIEWSSQTTRFLLFNNPDVYPKWQSITEFIFSVVNPMLIKKIHDTEKWITLGTIPLILAFFGLVRIKRSFIIILLFILLVIALISANNLLPFYELVLKQEWFILLRVTTRVWIIQTVIVIFLAGYSLEKSIIKNELKYLIICLSITELLILAWIRVSEPIAPQRKLVPDEVYQYILKDKSQFRVFCTTGCLSQAKTAQYEIETIEGYNTLQQTNYYKHAWELTKSYWNYYSLYLPPLGKTIFEKLQPSSKSLGEYNVKYIISPHILYDNGFELLTQFEDYKIYYNRNYKRRVYFQNDSSYQPEISFYSPNNINVEVNNRIGQLILADVYNSGWKAFINGDKQIDVLETPNALRAINLPKDTKYVVFKFQPRSFLIGSIITACTILILIFFLIKFYATKK